MKLKRTFAEEMAKPEFKHVKNAKKLSDEIGKLCEKKPTYPTVWGWVKRGRVPLEQEWLDALAKIYKLESGMQFFL